MRIEWDADLAQFSPEVKTRAKMYFANIVLWFLILGAFQLIYGPFSSMMMLETISLPVLVTAAVLFGTGAVLIAFVSQRFARHAWLSGIRTFLVSGFRRLLGEVASIIQNAASIALVIGLIFDRGSGLAWPGFIFLVSAIGLEMSLGWFRMKDRKSTST
ncbi:hypothetical protein [Achromobacter xylosoxidans]|uniref:Uncharacterized protein n=1 Tax=Alcaligenes xylosoxydans xylosoxydans TaxID=85698 RepID=A0A1R1JWU6_ALCXX|nr:hypothetical protein [Achromobacter xylosoxidans]OMG90614.1 hypothetical protein BIZ92_21455 [Achromobacter xylosoxidans]